MAFRSFLRLRRLQRAGKLLVFIVAACSISYFFLTFSRFNARAVIRNITVNYEQETRAVEESFTQSSLNVRVWRGLCGTNVSILQQSTFFPHFPDEKKLATDVFQVEDNTEYYGELIFGFLQPPTSGSYRFAIASDDSSELWLSPSEDPKQKRLIARVYSEETDGWTQKNELNKYPDQISQNVSLRRENRYYIEVIHKQGSGNGFVQVFWSRPRVAEFQLITSDHFQWYSNETAVMAKKDASHIAFLELYDLQYQTKANRTSNEMLKFYSLPLIPKDDYLPRCEYRTSSVWNGNIYRYEGQKIVSESIIYPADDTSMGDPGIVLNRPNRVADKDIIESVVNKMMTGLRHNTSKEYFLKKIHKVIQKSDPLYGDRFSVDLEVGLKHSKSSFRLSEHVFIKTGSGELCFPDGINWKSNATVYFILPVKNQGRWVYHFINEITIASSLTGDTNFRVMIVDFESQDIDMVKAFNTTLLRDRHTIVNMTGKFYKTLALNEAVARLPSEHDLLFLFDLHIDVPVDIMDSVRKNTIEGHVVYYPIVGRLACGSTSEDHQGFWAVDGFGLVAMYKSDWARIGGMNTEEFKYQWGGEDWDLLDRVVNSKFEVERIKHPGLYHHFHAKQKSWN